MESTSKFNLEKSLEQWKFSLYQKDSLTEDNIAELESHLLDETDVLRTKGLDEEEAFFVARKRLGETDLLVKEFEKLDDNLLSFNRLRFFIVGILFSWFVYGFMKIIFLLSGVITFYFFHTFESITTAVTIATALTVIIGLIIYRLFKIGKIKTLGICGNIPFLITIVILSSGIIPFFTQHSALNFSVYGRAMMGLGYFRLGFSLFVAVLAIFIHFKAKKKRSIA